MAGHKVTSSRAAALIVMVFTLGVSGCGPSAPLPRDTARTLLLDNLTLHCDPQTISLRASRLGIPTLKWAMTWFRNMVISGPDFHPLLERKSATMGHGELLYSENGQPLKVEWTMFHPPELDVRNRLTVRGCLYVPRRIHIIDTSFDRGGTRLKVLFQARSRLSMLGLMLDSVGLLAGQGKLNPASAFEYAAELRRNTDEWYVKSISPL